MDMYYYLPGKPAKSWCVQIEFPAVFSDVPKAAGLEIPTLL